MALDLLGSLGIPDGGPLEWTDTVGKTPEDGSSGRKRDGSSSRDAQMLKASTTPG